MGSGDSWSVTGIASLSAGPALPDAQNCALTLTPSRAHRGHGRLPDLSLDTETLDDAKFAVCVLFLQSCLDFETLWTVASPGSS